MGKGLLFLLAGVLLTSGFLLYDTHRVGQETAEEQVNYEEAIVAREIAQSAFDMGVSTVQRDFENGRLTLQQQDYQGGDYDLTTTTIDSENVSVRAEARFGEASVVMEGVLAKRLDKFLAALTFDVDGVVDPKADNNMTITGNDTPPPSAGGGLGAIGTGDGPDATAFLAITEPVRDLVASKFPHARVYGAGGTGDFQFDAPDVDLDRLYAETIQYPTAAVYTSEKFDKDIFPGGGGAHLFTGKKKEFKDVTFGSAGAPVVVRVTGVEQKFLGTTKGYGVLYLTTQKLEFKDSFRWEGLILIDAVNEKAEIKIDKGQVFGAMVVRRGEEEWVEEGTDGGLPGGHFDVDVFAPYKGRGMRKVYHQHQYDDKFNTTGVDLMSAGCKTGGGLCLNDLVISAGYEQVRAEFFNAEWSSGAYAITAGGTTYAGAPEDGFTGMLNAQELTAFGVNFLNLSDMWATSPGKVHGDHTNRNNAFTVRLYDTDTETDELIYELSVYEHANRCNIDCDAEGTGDTTYDDPYGDHETQTRYQPIKVEIKGTGGGVFYSTEAIMRLETLLETVAKKIQPAIVEYRTRGTGLDGRFTTE